MGKNPFLHRLPALLSTELYTIVYNLLKFGAKQLKKGTKILKNQGLSVFYRFAGKEGRRELT
jgi:hypothetical protein